MSEVRGFTLIGIQIAGDAEGFARRRGRSITPLFVMPAGELPDSLPPFRRGSVRADAEGKLWIGTFDVIDGSSVHHVVDDAGRLVARVGIPAGRTIVGFGRGGTVYLAVNVSGGAYLERVRFGP
jgi:hypothetical protein